MSQAIVEREKPSDDLYDYGELRQYIGRDLVIVQGNETLRGPIVDIRITSTQLLFDVEWAASKRAMPAENEWRLKYAHKRPFGAPLSKLRRGSAGKDSPQITAIGRWVATILPADTASLEKPEPQSSTR